MHIVIGEMQDTHKKIEEEHNRKEQNKQEPKQQKQKKKKPQRKRNHPKGPSKNSPDLKNNNPSTNTNNNTIITNEDEHCHKQHEKEEEPSQKITTRRNNNNKIRSNKKNLPKNINNPSRSNNNTTKEERYIKEEAHKNLKLNTQPQNQKQEKQINVRKQTVKKQQQPNNKIWNRSEGGRPNKQTQTKTHRNVVHRHQQKQEEINDETNDDNATTSTLKRGSTKNTNRNKQTQTKTHTNVIHRQHQKKEEINDATNDNNATASTLRRGSTKNTNRRKKRNNNIRTNTKNNNPSSSHTKKHVLEHDEQTKNSSLLYLSNDFPLMINDKSGLVDINDGIVTTGKINNTSPNTPNWSHHATTASSRINAIHQQQEKEKKEKEKAILLNKSISHGGTIMLTTLSSSTNKPSFLTSSNNVNDDIEMRKNDALHNKTNVDNTQTLNSTKTQSSFDVNHNLEPITKNQSSSLVVTKDANKIVSYPNNNNVVSSITSQKLSKLRDRWWNILREKEKQMEYSSDSEEDEDKDNDETSSSSSSTTDDDQDNSDSNLSYNATTKTVSPNNKDKNSSKEEQQQYINYYLETYKYPIHTAIYKNDTKVIKNLFLISPSLTNCNAFISVSTLMETMTLVTDSNTEITTTTSVYHPKKKNSLMKKKYYTTPLSIIHLATYLNLSNILNIILEYYHHNNSSSSNNEAVTATSILSSLQYKSFSPLMIAAEFGYDTCIDIFFSYGISSTPLNKKDEDGNTVIHLSCFSTTPSSSTIRLLLSSLPTTSSSSIQRLLCTRNTFGETPLHVACIHKRTDIVEEILNIISHTKKNQRMLFQKIFIIEDEFGRCPLITAVASSAYEIVALFLMWHCGNHYGNTNNKLSTLNTTATALKEKKVQCPLVIAVSRGDLDMIRLLLDFGLQQYNYNIISSSTSNIMVPFHLQKALFLSIKQNSCNFISIQDRLDTIQLLIESGANPHTYCYTDHDNDNYYQPILNRYFTPITPFIISACEGNIQVMSILLDSFTLKSSVAVAIGQQTKLKEKDPLLKKRNQSDFQEKERINRLDLESSSIYDAVLVTFLLIFEELMSPWRRQKKNLLVLFQTSLFLMKRCGVVLDDFRLHRLVNTYSTYLSPVFTCNCRFITQYPHVGAFTTSTSQKISTNTVYNKSMWSYWSQQLIRLPWIPFKKDNNVYCPYIRHQKVKYNVSLQQKHQKDLTSNNKDDTMIILIVAEGNRLLANRIILSSKSAKFAAAIRFADFTATTATFDGVVDGISTEKQQLEISIDLSFKIVSLLLQHIYHGSIVSGLSTNHVKCCQELLDLVFVAEEYLCPSLLLECEMRLLALEPYACFCWSCCNNTVKDSSGDDNKVICHYDAFSPSYLITADTAIDVFNTAKQIHLLYENSNNGYNYSNGTTAADLNDCSITYYSTIKSKGKHQYHRPFFLVKIIAIKTILQHFQEVLLSDSFLKQNCGSMSFDYIYGILRENETTEFDQDDMEQCLLYTCLNEIVESI